MVLFPTPTIAITEAPQYATLDELMASHAVIAAKEAVDRNALVSFFNPDREQFRIQLFQWASAGFPDLYIIKEISLTPPNTCSDGVSRDFYSYVRYLIEITNSEVKLQSLVPGISISYSYQSSSIRMHIMKS